MSVRHQIGMLQLLNFVVFTRVLITVGCRPKEKRAEGSQFYIFRVDVLTDFGLI